MVLNRKQRITEFDEDLNNVNPMQWHLPWPSLLSWEISDMLKTSMVAVLLDGYKPSVCGPDCLN